MSSHHSKRKSDPSSSHSHHKKKHKSSKASDSDDSGSGAPPPSIPNLTPISTDDYFLRANEFRLWLKERKKIYFEDLSSDESRKHFKKFVKRWNEGKLKPKYYESHKLQHQDTTKFKWGFTKNLSEKELDRIQSVTDSVDVIDKDEERKIKSKERDRRAGPATGPNRDQVGGRGRDFGDRNRDRDYGRSRDREGHRSYDAGNTSNSYSANSRNPSSASTSIMDNPRAKEFQAKEEKTMAMLRDLASKYQQNKS